MQQHNPYPETERERERERKHSTTNRIAFAIPTEHHHGGEKAIPGVWGSG